MKVKQKFLKKRRSDLRSTLDENEKEELAENNE